LKKQRENHRRDVDSRRDMERIDGDPFLQFYSSKFDSSLSARTIFSRAARGRALDVSVPSSIDWRFYSIASECGQLFWGDPILLVCTNFRDGGKSRYWSVPSPDWFKFQSDYNAYCEPAKPFTVHINTSPGAEAEPRARYRSRLRGCEPLTFSDLGSSRLQTLKP